MRVMEVVSDIFASLAVVFPEKNINFSRHKRSAKPNGRARVHRHSNHESNSYRGSKHHERKKKEREKQHLVIN